jgi:CheY-like chemotaxis protein
VPKKVLLVEDNEYTQNIYVKALGSAGLHVAVAADGQECLEHLVLDKPDLILLDLMMPVLDGFDVLRTIKIASSTKDIPVLVVSARDEQADIQMATKLGATGYLVKAQTRPRDVVAKVLEILGGCEKEESPARHYQVLLREDALDAPKMAADLKLPAGYCCAHCKGPLAFKMLPKLLKGRRFFLGHFACPACEKKKSTTSLAKLLE